MKDYGFDPKMMLTNLISIYSSLRTSKKFLSFIVKDPRSFKLEHFEKVIRLYEKKKIEVKDSSEIEGFSKMIEDLKEIEKEIKKQEVVYLLMIDKL
jgi:ubiquitin conjugation factor E4 B